MAGHMINIPDTIYQKTPDHITDIYVDDEPYIMIAIGCESQITHQVEIPY